MSGCMTICPVDEVTALNTRYTQDRCTYLMQCATEEAVNQTRRGVCLEDLETSKVPKIQ